MKRACLLLLALAAAALPLQGAPVLKTKRSVPLPRTAVPQQQPWWKALQAAILDIQKYGAGDYSTSDRAKEALVSSFHWDERLKRPRFVAQEARPSFCSSAVYVAVLSALMKWEEANGRRAISPEAWRALLPQLVKDGIGPWGYANANGPGFAMLVHRLGAGVNFTEWEKAKPSDIMKIWWNDAIGATERGHLVILVQDKGDSVRVWSSNQARDGMAGGYGLRDIPKSAIRRVLFTRITNPAAFNNAPRLKDDPWLTELMTRSVRWEDCAPRCGL